MWDCWLRAHTLQPKSPIPARTMWKLALGKSCVGWKLWKLIRKYAKRMQYHILMEYYVRHTRHHQLSVWLLRSTNPTEWHTHLMWKQESKLSFGLVSIWTVFENACQHDMIADNRNRPAPSHYNPIVPLRLMCVMKNEVKKFATIK